MEQVLAAPKITKNLTKFMCSPTSVCHIRLMFLMIFTPPVYRTERRAASLRQRILYICTD